MKPPSALSLFLFPALSKIFLSFVFQTPFQFTIVLPHMYKSWGIYCFVLNILHLKYWIYSSATCFWGSSMLVYITVYHSFPQLCTSHSYCFHFPNNGHLVVFSCLLLQTIIFQITHVWVSLWRILDNARWFYKIVVLIYFLPRSILTFLVVHAVCYFYCMTFNIINISLWF